MRGLKHPFFLRVEQREAIFNKVQPSVLILSGHPTPDVQVFLDLLLKTPAEQIIGFPEAAPAFVKLLKTMVTNDGVSLLMAFIDRLMDQDYEATMKVFRKGGLSTDLYQTCKRHIDMRVTETESDGWFVFRTLILLLGSIISGRDAPITDHAELNLRSQAFLDVVKDILKAGRMEPCQGVIEGLKRFLRVAEYREDFVHGGAVPYLLNLLSESMKLSHTDTLYHVLFCVWQLCYSVEGLAALSEREFVKLLSRLLSTVQAEREEIVRLMAVIIGELTTNMVFVENAFDSDILRLFRDFQGKKYVDSEITGEIATAAEQLHQNLKRISLWDKYTREVNSGVLRMTLSHKSEVFWKANIERFGENGYQILKDLTELMRAEDSETKVVACHDLGEYATRSPVGRVKLEEIGAKHVIMELLTSQDKNVQREALRTTQLLLLRNQ